MGALLNIANALKGYQPTSGLTVRQTLPSFTSNLQPVGNNVTLYPHKDGQTFIDKGYNYNADIHAVVSKCAKKFGQVAWYQYRIKKNEVKTWQEYTQLTKDGLTAHSVKEAKIMRKKSIEQTIVDSPLIKRLNRPNELQSGSQFREQLYGYKLLTGEANQLKVRSEDGKLISLEIVPKSHIALKGGASPYTFEEYIFNILGKQIVIPKMDLMMWKFPNYNFDPTTLNHLRGLAPLDAYMLHLQASNEGVIRLVNINNSQGAAGMLYRKDTQAQPSPEKIEKMRAAIDATINSNDVAGSIAFLGGDWGYHQFGYHTKDLQLMEQANMNMEKLCGILDVPYAMFKADQTYENKKQAKRDFIYDNIAVASYSLRDEWANKLIPEYNLDRERDALDCDVLSLPELTQDFKEQVSALKDAAFMSENEKRKEAGLEPKLNPVCDLTPLEIETMGLDSNLDEDLG